MKMTAYFFDESNSLREKVATETFRDNGGEAIGQGTKMRGTEAGERDVQYEVPDIRAPHCKRVLEMAGFRVEMERTILFEE